MEGKAISELHLMGVIAAQTYPSRAGGAASTLLIKRSENLLRNLTNGFFVEQSPQDAALQAVFIAAQQEGKPFDLLVEGEGSVSFGNTALKDLSSAPALPRRPLTRRSASSLCPKLFYQGYRNVNNAPLSPAPAGKEALLWYLPLSPNSTRGGKVFHMDPKSKHGLGGE